MKEASPSLAEGSEHSQEPRAGTKAGCSLHTPFLWEEQWASLEEITHVGTVSACFGCSGQNKKQIAGALQPLARRKSNYRASFAPTPEWMSTAALKLIWAHLGVVFASWG